MVSNDRGSATVLTVAWVVILITIGTVSLGIAQGNLLAGRTQAAADLAALAGAEASGSACARAGEIANANRADLVACTIQDGDVVVTVATPAPPLLTRVAAFIGRHVDRIEASSRAGQPSS